MKSCRDSNVKAQSLIAECIGELGAVDPGRYVLLRVQGGIAECIECIGELGEEGGLSEVDVTTESKT